jgi:hypothetical protein
MAQYSTGNVAYQYLKAKNRKKPVESDAEVEAARAKFWAEQPPANGAAQTTTAAGQMNPNVRTVSGTTEPLAVSEELRRMNRQRQQAIRGALTTNDPGERSALIDQRQGLEDHHY